ncbi:hypothetical protein [Caballeronia sp. Lep1P3]|uniref:hypothetical protein n=1 Tax=Caballeronia sp. Lep1P3 TaxID=2878150 RepID=UPI001FD37632|nr:hypothetical protein [Caballeronia sp. Lep1P3]
MSKNKLLIALTAGLFAATGALAQTSSGNSSAAMGGDTGGATATQGDASAGTGSTMTKKHRARRHTAHPSAGKKTPDVETGNNPAAESGQSK